MVCAPEARTYIEIGANMAAVLRSVSIILNIVYALIGFALSTVSIWFFIELKNITNLRNSDRYLLNFKVYWPQAIPWMFLTVGVLLVLVSLCGYCSACGGKSVLGLYYVFLILAIIVSIASGSVALHFADGKATDNFLSETIWDATSEMKLHKDIATAFGQIESRFRCCGAKHPREYTSWMTNFPETCCDPGSVEVCEFSNSLPHERHGCIEVVTQYARIFIQALAIASLVSSLFGVFNLIVGIFLWRNIKKPRKLMHNNDIDTLKLPLREK